MKILDKISDRSLRKLNEAAQSAGVEVLQATFEHIGAEIEMQGPSGGWVVKIGIPNTSHFDCAVGYNIHEVCADIIRIAAGLMRGRK